LHKNELFLHSLNLWKRHGAPFPVPLALFRFSPGEYGALDVGLQTYRITTLTIASSASAVNGITRANTLFLSF